MDFREHECCAECVSLGNTLRTTMIFFTINPDPQRNSYGDLLPFEQTKYIVRKLNMAIKGSLNMTILGVAVHFEFTQLGQVHAHGFILVNEREPNRKDLVYFSKIVHLLVGRPFAPAYVSCTLEWVDNDDIFRYVNKENAYPPIHKVFAKPPTPLVDFLRPEASD